MFDSLKKILGRGEKPSGHQPSAKGEVATPDLTPELRGFLSREPVFDRRDRPAGYLLQWQAGPGQTEGGSRTAHDRMLLELLADYLTQWKTSLAFIRLSEKSLDLAAVYRLPSEKTVLLVELTDTTDTAHLLENLHALRDKGFRLGLFRQPKHPAFAECIAQADIAAIAIDQVDPAAVRDFSAAVRASAGERNFQLLASNVESPDEHRLCKQWHYDYFHGSFAKATPRRPEEPGGDPHKVLLLNLLRLVQGDAETAEIAEAMKQDPLLAFRILRYLNSPALGLSRRIDSLGQALVILGRQRLTRWIAILLFSVREPNLGDWLLVENALTRGRLMELLGDKLHPGKNNDPYFLTGIFSCLDRLVRRPIKEIIDDMPLAPEVRDALLQRQGPYAPLLAVAEACEDFDLPRMEATAVAAGLDPDTVNRALLAATAWAGEVTEHWE